LGGGFDVIVFIEGSFVAVFVVVWVAFAAAVLAEGIGTDADSAVE